MAVVLHDIPGRSRSTRPGTAAAASRRRRGSARFRRTPAAAGRGSSKPHPAVPAWSAFASTSWWSSVASRCSLSKTRTQPAGRLSISAWARKASPWRRRCLRPEARALGALGLEWRCCSNSGGAARAPPQSAVAPGGVEQARHSGAGAIRPGLILPPPGWAGSPGPVGSMSARPGSWSAGWQALGGVETGQAPSVSLSSSVRIRPDQANSLQPLSLVVRPGSAESDCLTVVAPTPRLRSNRSRNADAAPVTSARRPARVRASRSRSSATPWCGLQRDHLLAVGRGSTSRLRKSAGASPAVN